MRVRAIVSFILLILPLSAFSADLIKNGSFETNGGVNSNVIPDWELRDEEGGKGGWVVQSGTAHPIPTDGGCTADVASPPAGSFAVMTTQPNGGQGSHVLYQDVTIPAGTSPVLSFQFYARNFAGGYVTPDSLSFTVIPNQQFRADIIDPAANPNPFTLNVLQNVLLIGQGNVRNIGYETVTANLIGFGGRTVRIRFVEVDNQFCLNVGVDDVHLETQPNNPRPGLTRFTVGPIPVPFAGTTTLTWSTQNATSVEINDTTGPRAGTVIGPVPVSGSRAISLQSNSTFTLTATGPGGVVSRDVLVPVNDPGPQIRFSSEPDLIDPGQPATLRWTTTGATAVSIDNGIGPVASSDELIVTPSVTTEYTLTATGDGITSKARTTVFVNPGDVPIVSVTQFPRGIVGLAGTPAGVTDQFALTNLGKVATNITLTPNGTFFTLSPASFALPADATQIVTITTTTNVAGNYEGTVVPSGTGVPAGLTIRVRLFLAVAPAGTIVPRTAVARTEIAAPAGENPSGSVSFTNSGTGTLQGIATSDVPWLIPQSGVITIGPGETKAVTFTTNRALRPDASSQGGAAIAVLTLTYIDFGGSSSRFHTTADGSSKGTISVTIVDIVKPGATKGAPPPLEPGELALFVPGLFQGTGTSSDVSVSVKGSSISDLKLYFGGEGSPPVLGSLDQIAPNAGLILSSALQSVAGIAAQTGTVQARSKDLSRVSLAGSQTATSTSASYITALPTFRSDRAAGAGGVIYLPGIEKKAQTRSTNVFVQEVAGFDARATIDFLDPTGTVVRTLASQRIDPFTLLSLSDSAPAGAASIRVTNTSTTIARIVAYALVVDAVTQDEFVVVDSQSTDQIIGVPGSVNNSLYVFNPGNTPLDIAIDNQVSSLRRRAVRTSTDAATNLTIGPLQTTTVPINFPSGYVRVTAARPFALTARSMKIGAFNGTFGSALPVFSTSTALGAGDSRRFGNVEDASRATVDASTPVTYRSSLGLIETSGQPAMVRLTLRYSFSAGTKTSAQGISNLTVSLTPNRFMMLDELARSIIGPSRDKYGDLHNMQLDVDVVSGAGRVLPFLQTIDNSSTDSAIRTE